MKIGIIDYGMGNLFSVEQAVKRLGAEVLISADKEELLTADALILPGVGAFPDAMARLEETNLVSLFDDVVATKKPLLGICLGMQLLFEESIEKGDNKGLGLFKGSIAEFSGEDAEGKTYRVPHMGWNNLQFKRYPTWLSKEALDNDYVYFVHSFYATDVEELDLVAYADYGGEIVPGIVQKGSITGMQFHPEKSGSCGVTLLTSWLQGIEKGEV
ncbi:imidazole glycerol phosphate synthase subunit HisH [Kurthia huakuii]|uniref:imidazole glycerol phosphate synthase subunit HisH n=1 Tax=Kurthia huakuii TaxID=1421019 RepID=UPI00049632AC|nr:imidazole glycerol phosphate synthase subunit HisH [Kurthia huakuii]MBM7699628.1 glutamine amidotransferase [Kurthia huakuii]